MAALTELRKCEMTPQRKWTKEGIEAYLALHSKTTIKEMTENVGGSKQRVFSILRSFV